MPEPVTDPSATVDGGSTGVAGSPRSTGVFTRGSLGSDQRQSDGVATAEAPWGVGVLGDKLKGWIDRLGQVWVEGEITQWGVRGANVYGKLKDLERDVTVSFQIWSSVGRGCPTT